MVNMLLQFKELKAPNQQRIDDALDVLQELEDENLDFINASADPNIDLEEEVDKLFKEGLERDLVLPAVPNTNTAQDVAPAGEAIGSSPFGELENIF